MVIPGVNPALAAMASLHGLACQSRPVRAAQGCAPEAVHGREDARSLEKHAASARESGQDQRPTRTQDPDHAERADKNGRRLDDAPCPACRVLPCACQAVRRGPDAPDQAPAQAPHAETEQSPPSGDGPVNVQTGLSAEERQTVQELKQRDREVRAHEQAHVAAGGGHVQGGISYQYQTGPDGRQYAVGGSVNIDASPVPGNPEATEEKARAVRRAALAPASPSGQDRVVAARASQMEAEARVEKRAEDQAEDNPLAPGANAPEAMAEKRAEEREAGREPEPVAESVQATDEDRRRARAMQAYGAQVQEIEAREPEFFRAA